MSPALRSSLCWSWWLRPTPGWLWICFRHRVLDCSWWRCLLPGGCAQVLSFAPSDTMEQLSCTPPRAHQEQRQVLSYLQTGTTRGSLGRERGTATVRQGASPFFSVYRMWRLRHVCACESNDIGCVLFPQIGPTKPMTRRQLCALAGSQKGSMFQHQQNG